MARISISQTMLVLNQGKDIPALKRALPIFEEILDKKKLYTTQPGILDQGPARSQSQDKTMAAASASTHVQGGLMSSELEQYENDLPFDADFLGFDFLDEWQVGQLDFTS